MVTCSEDRKLAVEVLEDRIQVLVGHMMVWVLSKVRCAEVHTMMMASQGKVWRIQTDLAVVEVDLEEVEHISHQIHHGLLLLLHRLLQS